eukprot:scaffold1492_cov257-Pinguiococcus_pyrenoidosus.AAC.15
MLQVCSTAFEANGITYTQMKTKRRLRDAIKPFETRPVTCCAQLPNSEMLLPCFLNRDRMSAASVPPGDSMPFAASQSWWTGPHPSLRQARHHDRTGVERIPRRPGDQPSSS